jgi:hypothetical protein
MPSRRRYRKRLGQIMLDKGLITPSQLSDALTAQTYTREKLGRILVRLGFVSELHMFRAVRDQDGLPFPSRFLPYFHRGQAQPPPPVALARDRTRISP